MSNEITVRIKGNKEEVEEILKNNGFIVKKKYILNDIYFIPELLNFNDMNSREILSKAILLREITEETPEHKEIKLTFKTKNIAEDGKILEQTKIDCNILNYEEGRTFLEAIGYNELMNIKEKDIVYERNELEIVIKDVVNGDNLLEIETVEENSKLDTTDKLIKKVEELNIPIITENYFVKKAEIELAKKLKKY